MALTENRLKIYSRLALEQIPRILGLGDRHSNSKTYGCFDRYYWHYRLIDCPNARFQETALLLALLYTYNFPGNVYYKNKKLREWSEGAVRFWAAIRNKDGSLNEVYPFERSFCATSFSTWAIAETIKTLNLEVPIRLERTANWLTNQKNPEVSNQIAASALALYNLHFLIGDSIFLEAAEERVEYLMSNQAPDGYFPEYRGPDIGYQTLTLSCLTRYWQNTGDSALAAPLQKAADFLERNIGDQGRFQLEGTSRRTQFIYPYGLAFLKSRAIERHIEGLKNGHVLQPGWLDDRYVIALTIDYLQTSLIENNHVTLNK